MLKKILIGSIGMFFAATLLAQNLPGVVLRNARTQEVLGYASLRAFDGSGGAMTDSTGFAALPHATEGSMWTASLTGYQNKSFTWNGPVEILLEPLDELLHEVVVSGTLRAMSRSESPVPVEVYTPKFFKQTGATGLLDGLRMANGVQAQTTCNVCGTADIRINGLDGPYTMILIDGMPIVSALSTVYGLQGIPTGLIERLEVVKGPSSTLYGSEAVAGVINIITRDVLCAPRFTADVQGSNQGEWNAELGGRFRLGKKADGLLSGNMYRFGNRLDVNDDNFTDMPLQERYAAFGKIRFERPQKRLAGVTARYVWEDRFGGEMQWKPEFYSTDSVYGEKIRTDRLEILGQWQAPLRDTVVFSFSFNDHAQNSTYGTTLFNARQRVSFAQVLWEKSLGRRHQTAAGASVRHTWYDDNTPVTAGPDGAVNAPSSVVLPGIFLQDDIKITADHRLLLGMRFDHHPAHGAVWSPRANWKWTLSESQILRFSAGNGFRVANVFSEDHAALTGARQVVFEEALEPEKSWNANVNWTAQFFPEFGLIGLDVSVFHTRFSNRILADYSVDPNLVVYRNLDGFGVSQGMSVRSDWSWEHGLRISGAVTLLNVYVEEQGKRRPQLYAPGVSGNASVAYTIQPWHLTLDANATLTGPMHLPIQPNDFRPELSPWYTLIGLQFTRPWKSLEVYAGVRNLFNFLPQDPIMRPFDPFDQQAGDPVGNPQGYTFDPGYNYAPMQGRRVYFGVRLKM